MHPNNHGLLFGSLLAFLFLAMVGASSLMASHLDLKLALAAGVALVVITVVFFKTEYALYLLIASMLLSPEFGFGSLGGSSGRGVTFRFEDLLVVMVGITWLIKCAIFKDLGVIRKTSLNGPMQLYIAACALSTGWGVVQGRVSWMTGTLFVVKYVQYFVIFFLVINTITSEKQIKRFWTVLLATAIVVSLIGVAQIAGGDRVSAPFEGAQPEPNTFGGYLTFLLLLCLGVALTSVDLRSKLFYFGLTALLSMPLIYTLSRASYLAVAVGLPVVLLLRRKTILIYAAVPLALAVLLAPRTLLPRPVYQRLAFTLNQGETRGARRIEVLGNRIDSSTSARLTSFSAALKDFVDKPVLGYGVTGWHFIDSQFFRTLIETGLVGLAAFLYLLWRIFGMARRRLKQFRGHAFYEGLTIGFLAGLTALIAHSLGSNTFIIVRIMEPFWLVTGLLFMAGEVVAAEPLSLQKPVVFTPSGRPSPRPRRFAAALPYSGVR